ncbi:oligosaccharide flippase family protein [Phyllobacterium sp. 21LDTY02-6]|uniref:oligosaccharide flippase family protein n=1 Tax=Phyllobacterium sp. 21LDTY02-6 TaxID=2944903 RepID=UPI00201FBE98|nr:oligosaccharide flippase family protein [Phyllobacterium sp. 21LDTY02-6]MCO4319283.1 oligosaccharide flippase family protein [Phyllobacterium sp. 21LDTY02-6]
MGIAALGSRVSAQVAQMAVFILAARTLTAAEFGLYTLTLAIAIFLTRVAEAGSREFIMSCREDRSLLDQIGTAAIISGAAGTAGGLIAAKFIDSIFSVQGAASLLCLFSAWVFLATLSAVYTGLLVRRSQSELHSVFLMVGEAVGLLTALAGLYSGLGIFALAIGKLSMQVIYLSAAFVATKWFPRLRLEWSVVRELAAFSRHILSTRMIAYIQTYAVTFIIGGFIGTAGVGYYRVAERLASSFFELMEEPARLISWVSLRRVIDNDAHHTETKLRVGQEITLLMPFLLALALPIFIGLALVSEDLVVLLLGEPWHPAAPITSILALAYLMCIPQVLSEPALSLTGQINLLPRISLFNAAIAIAIIFATVPSGIEAVAAGQFAAGVISFIATVWLQFRYGRVSWGRIARRAAIVLPGLAAMAGAVLWFAAAPMAPGLKLALQVATGAIAYGLIAGAAFFIAYRSNDWSSLRESRATGSLD